MELRNLIDQYCYDCSEGWFMVYAETGGKYEEFYQDLLSDATAKISEIRSSFVEAIFYKIRKVHKVFQNGKKFALTWSQYQQYH